MYVLIGDSWFLISTFVFNLLQDVVLSMGRKSGLHRSILVVRKERCVFQNNYGYSPLIVHQKLTSGAFLQVSCKMESKVISTFSCSVTLNPICLPCPFKGSFIHVCACNMHWSFGKYWRSCANFPMSVHLIKQYQKIIFVYITINLIRKILIMGNYQAHDNGYDLSKS